MFYDGLAGCQNCAYRIKSQEEAARLLHEVIRTAHMQTMDGGGLLMEARLDMGTVLDLCSWKSACEDCEVGEHYGDGPELWDIKESTRLSLEPES